MKRKPPFLSLDLPSDEAARALAEDIAARTGRMVTVTDERGDEVHETQPRRNELIVRPKNELTPPVMPEARQPRSKAVTPEEMRKFAAECLRWSETTGNASQRDLMIQIAKSWMHTAATLERHADNGEEILPDLRRKLD